MSTDAASGTVPTRPGEAELRSELVELLRRYGLQIPTAERVIDGFAAAVEERVRADEREKCAAELERAGEVEGGTWRGDGLRLAARLVRESGRSS